MKLGKKELIKLYTNMVRVRKMDALCIQSLQSGKIQLFYHSCQGEEAVGVGACTFLNKDDYIYHTHRGHGILHALPKGIDPKAFIAEHYGKATGAAHGMAGFHCPAPEIGILGLSGTIGSVFPISAGWGLAAKKRGKKQVVVAFFGDGTSNRGTLHPSFNLASLWKLPIVWLCENNQYAQFMPITDAYAREDIADLAAGYNMPGVVVDGQDVIAVYEAVQAAVERAREGDGPSLIECKTYRYYGHTIGTRDESHAVRRSQEEIDTWKKRDPIKLFEEKLLEQNVLTQADIERIDREGAKEAEEADKFAMESPLPDPSILEKALYAD